MDSLVVWITIYHEQRAELDRYGVVHPCSDEKRFHLSRYLSDQKHLQVDPLEYSGRGFFMVQVEISAIEYLRRVDSGTLERINEGEYWWYGPLRKEVRDDRGVVLYRFLY